MPRRFLVCLNCMDIYELHRPQPGKDYTYWLCPPCEKQNWDELPLNVEASEGNVQPSMPQPSIEE